MGTKWINSCELYSARLRLCFHEIATIRLPAIGPGSLVYRDRADHAGAGNRRQHRHFQRDQRRPAQAAALSAGAGIDGGMAPGAGRGGNLRQYQLLAHHVLHLSRGESHISRFRNVVQRRRECDRSGRSRTGAGAGRHVRNAASAGGTAGAGTLVLPGRRYAGDARDGDADLWLLAAALRRRSSPWWDARSTWIPGHAR